VAAVQPFSNLVGNPVVTSDGKIFLNFGNSLYARQEADGAPAWQHDFTDLQYASSNPPAVANGAVYIAAGQQSTTFMFSFAAGDGTQRFKSPMASQWESYLNPVVGADGVYTNAGTYGGLYGFDTIGQPLFVNGLEQQSMWSPAASANGIFSYTGRLVIAHPTTGAIVDAIPDPQFVNYVYRINGAPVLGNDSVFVAHYSNAVLNGGGVGNRLMRFRPSTSSIAWSIAGNYPSTPAYAGGVAYVANEAPFRVEGRAESDGSLVWSWIPPTSGAAKFASEVLVTNNVLFVSTTDAAYGVEIASKRLLWSWPRPGRFALSRNGVLYLFEAGHLTAINAK
jgi:hypothetical protein